MNQQQKKQEGFTKSDLMALLEEKAVALSKLQRQTEVETALERVRARTMAMKQSVELLEVIYLLTSQLQLLGFKIDVSNFNTNYREKDWSLWMWVKGFVFPDQIGVPYFDHPYFKTIDEALSKGQEISTAVFTREENVSFREHMVKNASNYPEPPVGENDESKGLAWSVFFARNISVTIANFDAEPYSEDQNAILRQFANTFEQSYTRFFDLQRAEAQAREAQVQLALERVRARTMAMQKSNELSETAYILFGQFKELGEVPDQVTIGIFNEDKGTISFWLTINGSQVNQVVDISIEEPAVMHKIFVAWKEQQSSLIIDLSGQELHDYIEARNFSSRNSGIQVVNDFTDSRRVINVAFFSKGFLTFSSAKPSATGAIKLLERFANVFDLTYARFLDLRKAEAQAREAMIELGLERVRSKAMAMQRSEDLKELISTVFIELTRLDFVLTRCLIMIYDPKTKDSTWWMANAEAPEAPIDLLVQYHEQPAYLAYLKAWKERNVSWEYVLEGTTKKRWDDFLFVETGLAQLPALVIEGMKAPSRVYLNASFNSFGNLTLATLEPLSKDHFDILGRFAKVFDLTYTRFNDLQKAEAQAREATVEAALERIRSKTMAMHNSNDVGDTVAALFSELLKLGIETIRCGIGIMNDSKEMEVWTARPIANDKVELVIGNINMDIHPLLQGAFRGWKEKQEIYSYELEGEDLVNYFTAINSYPAYPVKYDLSSLPGKIFHDEFHFPEGTLFAFSVRQLTDDTKKIFKRFAGVFAQTYRRYLDLQKAEAQARESQIETGLERVRGLAMAMHDTQDLSTTANMVFTELNKLGINPIRCGVGLLNEHNRTAQLYSATSSKGGDSLELIGWVLLSGHPVMENIYYSWVKNENYFPELAGEELRLYYELLLKGLQVQVPDSKEGQKQYGHFLPFSIGCLYAWSDRPYTDAEIKILKRFAAIIDLTFRRYLELQQSEAATREARKQAALDRVRAEIASMRTTADLERITPLVWNELNILGVPFIRCGVFIMDDLLNVIHTFLSTPDGKAIAAFHMPFSTPGNIAQVLNHWKKKEVYVDRWNEADFREFAAILVLQGALSSTGQYLDAIPHGGFYLHFLPFLQGMLYVGNTSALKEEEMGLVQAVADAFSTAYSRYEDFNKMEAAKKQVDIALDELRVTQKQLIQSEKMASLGELTAGIAHEIQNPLNFVNNFSEVNKELIGEMQEELEKGNFPEAKAIAGYIKENEEKINHHGRRADAIVKGMLQHSRSSTGIKEPTDINALADEYLRLAYHGLRAKDKEFNSGMSTNFDPEIENINLIPQDIGRVLLNLYTNAFYAVNKKAKQDPGSFKPMVTVSTKKTNNSVELTVADNGNGMPPNIVDKVFQPFFTTKPTGEGTGLGLSLSYDIIKAHGGEIKVETKESKGSKFVIQLPGV